ncbi:MAG: ComEC/Rec2 family competence protein [Terrimicrobiaceae bacterium]|nr:ComEC/Rec2 family competence protein [Terrimicrobiaceae bacterium]
MDAAADQIPRAAVSGPPGVWRAHFLQISRQRLPFVPLVLAAGAGILGGGLAEPWLMGVAAVALLAASLLAGRTGIFLAGCFCLFAALAGWDGSAARRLAQARPGPEVAVAEGVVISEPRPAGADRWALDCRVSRLEFEDWQGPVDVPVAVRWAGPPPSVGDRVRVVGTWERVRSPRNPAAFDSARWHALRGIFSQLRAAHPADARVVAAFRGFSLRRLAAAARQRIAGALTQGLEPESPQAHLIVAMTLGDTRPLEESLLEDFRGTGTFHLFSVSGLHVGMLGLLLWLVLRTLRAPPRLAAALIIPALFFYALVTGWKPASVRAATMAAFVLAGLMADRPPAVLNSLAAAAFFILLADTRQLFNPGFQLSFAVVFALVLFAPPLEQCLRKALAPDALIPPRIYTQRERWQAGAAKAFAPLLAVSAAAWVGSSPLTIAYFHVVSFVAVPANMVCVPLAFCAMGVAMLSVASATVLPWLGVVFNNANWALASLLMAVVHVMAALPGAFVFAGPLTWGETMRLTVLDMGSGAAQFVESRGRKWLFDAGPLREFDRTLRPFLRARGVNRLDGLVLSHGDAAHIGAAGEAVRFFSPRVLAAGPLADRSPVRRALYAEWEERGLEGSRWQAGDAVELAPGLRADVLFPPPGILSEAADDKAMVVAIEFEQGRILLLSDAGPSTEHWLLRNARGNLAADIVVKGSHRGGVALTEEFIEAVSPRLVIATHRTFPSSEKIPPETLSLLQARAIPILRLDEQGAVIVTARRAGIEARGFAGGARVVLPAEP